MKPDTVSVSPGREIEGKKRDLAHFNLAVDCKRRGWDVVAVPFDDDTPSSFSSEETGDQCALN